MIEKIKTIPEFTNYIRTKLGEPKIRVELANSQIETNLSDGIQLYREYSNQNGSFHGYLAIDLEATVNTYTLPDNILQVITPKRSNQTNSSAWVLASMSGAMASDALSLKSFDTVTYTMLNQWLHNLQILTPSPFKTMFNNNTKVLQVIPTPDSIGKLFLSVQRAATVDELLDERWVKDYTLAKCQISLGQLRSKFKTIPGFGGNIALDGEELKTTGEAAVILLEDDLIKSFKYSRPPLPLFRNN